MFSQLVNPPGRRQIVSKGQMKRYIRAVRDSNFIALLLQQAGIHASHVHLCHANSVLLPQQRILACDSGLPLQTRFDGGRLGITNRTRQLLSPIECVHDQRAGAHCGLKPESLWIASLWEVDTEKFVSHQKICLWRLRCRVLVREIWVREIVTAFFFPAVKWNITKILIKFFVYRLGLQENKIKSKAVKNMFCKEALCQYNGQKFNGLEANFLRLKHIY